MEELNEKAPDPEQNKKQIKVCTFTRSINNEKITPEKPSDNAPKEPIEGPINLTVTMTLYEEEIEISAKVIKEKFKVPTLQYEKHFSLEEIKNFNKFFALLKIGNIFDIFQKSFEQKYDVISQAEEQLQIKLMMNIMDVVTEEIFLNLPRIKLTNEDELESMKETIKYLVNERNSLKEEVKSLNNTLQEIKSKIEENNNFMVNEEKEFQNKIAENKNELIKNLQEATNAHLKKENELQNNMDEKEQKLQIQSMKKNKSFKIQLIKIKMNFKIK